MPNLGIRAARVRMCRRSGLLLMYLMAQDVNRAKRGIPAEALDPGPAAQFIMCRELRARIR
jgi:hypothetical protein